MSLINLSEQYLINSKPPFYIKFRMALYLDLYWTSSLYAIEAHFRDSPQTKKDILSSTLSAYVVMKDLEIKRMHPDSFEEEDGVSLDGLDNGMCFLFFEIKDNTIERLASWKAGISLEYLKAQEVFGFNRESYVPIPKIILKYRHDDSRGFLTIVSLDMNRKFKTKKKKLKDRILDIIPRIQIPILHPSH